MKIEKSFLATVTLLLVNWSIQTDLQAKLPSKAIGNIPVYEEAFYKSSMICLAKILNTDDLVLLVVTDGNKRILRVSFNGNEGTDGTFKIYNASHKLVIESNFELIKSPYYASVDISALQPGKYIMELTTTTALHSTILSVK